MLTENQKRALPLVIRASAVLALFMGSIWALVGFVIAAVLQYPPFYGILIGAFAGAAIAALVVWHDLSIRLRQMR